MRDFERLGRDENNLSCLSKPLYTGVSRDCMRDERNISIIILEFQIAANTQYAVGTSKLIANASLWVVVTLIVVVVGLEVSGLQSNVV